VRRGCIVKLLRLALLILFAAQSSPAQKWQHSHNKIGDAFATAELLALKRVEREDFTTSLRTSPARAALDAADAKAGTTEEKSISARMQRLYGQKWENYRKFYFSKQMSKDFPTMLKYLDALSGRMSVCIGDEEVALRERRPELPPSCEHNVIWVAETEEEPAKEGRESETQKREAPIIFDVSGEIPVQGYEVDGYGETHKAGKDSALRKSQSTQAGKGIPAIVKATEGAIVSVVMSDRDGKPIAQGSGFFVSKDGLILTNYHVIAEGSSAIVKLPDGAYYVVDGVRAFDKVRDIAVIKARGHNFRTLTLGSSERVQVGEEVVAIGNPLSLESTVSNGIVSGIRTDEQLGGRFLQITAPISPGSSGGPLFNMDGQVIGITTMYLEGGENLNFAIPIDDAKRLLLSKSSTLREWPDEHESVKREKRGQEGQAPSSELTENTWPTVANLGSAARRFYEQDKEAGIFAPEEFGTAPDGSKVPLGRMRKADYVCFSSDARSDEFFTFRAWAYDKEYDEALHLLDKAGDPSNPADREDFFKRQAKQNEIQGAIKQAKPYVNFLPGDLVNGMRSDMRQFFLGDGRVLQRDDYSKGVKIDTLEYHWDGTSWFFHDLWFLPVFGATSPKGPDVPTSTPRALHLSIQPFKKDLVMEVLRYVDSDANRDFVASGFCENVK